MPTANQFTFLRYLAASLVIFRHAYALNGFAQDPFDKLSHSLDGFVVGIFFIISGYLVTQSYHQTPRLYLYVKKRFLRIYPALLCSILVVIAVGAMVSPLPLAAYFHHPLTMEFIYYNALFVSYHYSLPGVFTSHPHPLANGSYWTLPLEAFMYVMVAALAVSKRWFKRGLPVLLLLLYGWYALTPAQDGATFLTMSLPLLLKNAVFFFAGSFFYVYREQLTFSAWAALAALVLIILSFPFKNGVIVMVALLPYIVLYVAFLPLPRLARFSSRVDYSYGLYLYHWPIEQLIIHYYGIQTIPVLVFFALSYGLTLLAAILSWHLIEAPALRFK